VINPENSPNILLSRSNSQELNLAVAGILDFDDLIGHESLELQVNELIDRRNQNNGQERERLLSIDKEAFNNARTCVWELMTAAGHLSTLRQTGDMEYLHKATMQRLLNGYLCCDHKEEKARRYIELVEQLKVNQLLGLIQKGVLKPGTRLLTKSNYIDAVDDDTAYGLGYRPLNRKGMYRTTTFELDEQGHLYQVTEQVSVSNSTDGATEQWFIQNGLSIESSFGYNSESVLKKQLLLDPKKYPNGVVDVARAVDEIRVGMFGENYLWGESASQQNANGFSRSSYESIRADSRNREQSSFDTIKLLTDYEQQLERTYLHTPNSRQIINVLYARKADELVQKLLLGGDDSDKGLIIDSYGMAAYRNFVDMKIALSTDNFEMFERSHEKFNGSKDRMAAVACGGKLDTSGLSVASDDQKIGSSPEVYAGAKSEVGKRKNGVCIIAGCPSRPGKTELGGCGICIKNCQVKFDQGKDPRADLGYIIRTIQKTRIENNVK
jgi:hypothetical protein